MRKFKISEISEPLKIPHTKCKRYAREFLGPDPDATIQSGRARSLTFQETYHIYLGAHLVSDNNSTVHEAKIIIKNLKPWLIKLDLFPGDDNNFQETKSEIKSWKIFIYQANKPFSFHYEAEGVISIDNDKVKTVSVAGYQNKTVTTKTFVHIPLVDLNPDPEPQSYYWNSDKVMILRASYLKEIFKLKIEGKKPVEHIDRWLEHRVLY